MKKRVLLISGWAHGAEAMQPMARAMSKSYLVTSFCLNELGVNKGQAGKISDYARGIALHLDTPAFIVGWSTGAVAALEAAANYPGKVAGLVLLSATARFCSNNEYAAGVRPAVLRAMIRGLSKDPEAVIADFLSEAFYPMNIPEDELARRTQNTLRQGTQPLIDGLEYLAGVDLRGALPAITASCLVVHGGQDRIVPWQAAQYLASNLPHSEAEFLPSAGHSLIKQGGKHLIHRIRQFLDSIK
ncbi:putative Carboxylesterase [Syntrophobacter sp. SbD1]|nr:putative Carboxylesterase [Syntrophobacter sp. SbD1]